MKEKFVEEWLEDWQTRVYSRNCNCISCRISKRIIKWFHRRIFFYAWTGNDGVLNQLQPETPGHCSLCHEEDPRTKNVQFDQDLHKITPSSAIFCKECYITVHVGVGTFKRISLEDAMTQWNQIGSNGEFVT